MEENKIEVPVAFYPNPTTGKFSINRISTNINSFLIVCDVSGRIVFNSLVKTSEFDISFLENGIYSAFIKKNGFMQPVKNKIVLMK